MSLLKGFEYLGLLFLCLAGFILMVRYIREITFVIAIYTCHRYELSFLQSFGIVTLSVLSVKYLDTKLTSRFMFYFRIKNSLGHTVRSYLQSFRNIFRG